MTNPSSRPGRRLALAAALALAALAPATATLAQAPPPFVQRGLPGPFHAALEPLVGDWNVDKQIFIAIGTPEKPATSTGVVAHRKWVGGGKHLMDLTEGKVGGEPYYRLGVMGFSNVDHRYEWVTFDALNANQMLYYSPVLKTPGGDLELKGVFTDQGLLGEAYAGRAIPMRTVVHMDGPDRHVISLYFDPPGKPEILIDRSIYTRIKP